MKDRNFSELGFGAQIRGGPAPANERELHRAEGRLAVEIGHKRDLETIASCLMSGQSVLVQCDKTLSDYIYLALAVENGPLGTKTWEVVQTVASPPQPGSLMRFLIGVTTSVLGTVQQKPNSIALIRHLDLLAWTVDNRPSPDLPELIYWLAERREAVILAFWDPIFPMPKVIESFFPNRLTLPAFDREVMWELLTQEEAKRVSPPKAFTIAAQCTLYQYVAGTNVVEMRRILRGLVRKFNPEPSQGQLDLLYDYIRQQTGLAPLVPKGEVVGYSRLERELRREVLLPMDLRKNAGDEAQLRQADELMPRGVLLYGPPGTGKTEWARWLAHTLRVPLLIINGPELKNKFVGETEAAIRRVFLQARRSAPSIILIDEIDAMMPSRDRSGASNFDVSMVGQLLAEMDGMRQEEGVIVLGTTNRINDIDDAFLRPGRFGTQIEVPYPEASDRKLILKLYCEKMSLKLREDSVDYLVERTRAVGFSGDHLRAICRFLLLESRDLPLDNDGLNDLRVLDRAIDTVRSKSKRSQNPEGGQRWGNQK